MKGIAGIVYPDPLQMHQLLIPMLDTIKHRAEKTTIDQHIYKNIQIGLVGGNFAHNEKRTISAGVDGYFKNANALFKELKNYGFHFKENTIDELIVHGYEHWGVELFDHLKGEFAIVILDQRKKQLILCRDRIGKKPLYWAHSNQYFLFASELKAIISTGLIPQTPALDALSSYLYFGYIPQDMTPITGVNKLLPAHYLLFHFSGSKQIASYWSYSSFFLKRNTKPPLIIAEELDQLLKNSVASSFTQKEPIGCFLSGGLGSATIAYYTKEVVSKENLTAFTVGFATENNNDIEAAKLTSDLLGIQNVSNSITKENFLDDLVKIAWYIDEPLADPHVISAWNLAKLAAKYTKTVLSGMGSDELFAGHSRYILSQKKDYGMRGFLHFLLTKSSHLLIPLFNFLYKPLAFELVKQSRTNPWQFEYLMQNALMTESEIKEASPRLGGIFDPEVFLHKFHHLGRVPSTVSSFLYFDVKTRLADNYLLQFERLTAANALHWRVPFLDRSIVEYLAQLPEPEYLQESETASYLKAMMKDVFPESLINRSKRTRKQFLRNWLTDQKMQKLFTHLLDGTLVETGMISPSWLRLKLTNLERDPLAANHLWAILLLEIWFRLFINKPIGSSPPNVTVESLLQEPS